MSSIYLELLRKLTKIKRERLKLGDHKRILLKVSSSSLGLLGSGEDFLLLERLLAAFWDWRKSSISFIFCCLSFFT